MSQSSISVRVPDMNGLRFLGPLSVAIGCLRRGGSPEDCSVTSGLRLDLTQFFALTDVFSDGPVKLLFQNKDKQPIKLQDFDFVNPTIFGQAPAPGLMAGPGIGSAVLLRVTGFSSFLGRFPIPGDSGLEVLQLQQALEIQGFLTETSGIFDDATKVALRAYRDAHGVINPLGTSLNRTLINKVWIPLGLPVDKDGRPI
jgi:hypothetical protein